MRFAHPFYGTLFLLFLATILAGCTNASAFLDYSRRNMFSSSLAGNLVYQEIGPAGADASNFVWTPCEKLTAEVAELLLEQAKVRGGNALMDVRWARGDFFVQQPNCRTAWGWLALYGVGILGPWVKSAESQATIISIPESELKKAKGQAGIILLKDINKRS